VINGTGALGIPSGLPASLIGIPLYLQAAADVSGQLEVSDLGVVIYTP
jgi:hypothetical protein